MAISLNIKRLREKKNLSQKSLAELLGVKTNTISNYENGVSEPSLDICVKLSAVFGVDYNTLLSENINFVGLPDVTFASLPQVSGVSNILVPIAANAGISTEYTQEYIPQDPEPVYVPGLAPGRYRTFPIAGDSMEPFVTDGDYLVASRVADIRDCKLGQPYIIVATTGIYCKQLLLSFSGLELHSYNPEHPSYEIAHDEIAEVWQPCLRITSNFTDSASLSARLNHVETVLRGVVINVGNQI